MHRGKRSACALLSMALILAANSAAWAGPSPQPSAVSTITNRASDVAAAASSLLVQNVGQFAPGARFLWLDGPGRAWLADDAIWITLLSPIQPHTGSEHARGRRGNAGQPAQLRGTNLRLSFPGSNLSPELFPFDRSQSTMSYFIGSDPSGWYADAPVWRGARYRDLYPGVDLVIGDATAPWRLEGHAKSALTGLRLRIEGAQSATVEGGSLRIGTAAGDLLLPLPAATGQAGERAAAAVTRLDPVASETFDVALSFPAAAPASPATPAGASDLVFGTYLGGSSWDEVYSVAVDASGATYLTGDTASTNFPISAGAFDTVAAQTEVFVTKLDAGGAGLVYSTFLGGGSQETGWGIAVDGSGQAYITGETLSTNFPVTPGGYDLTCGSDGTCDANGGGPYTDAFMAKLNASGTSLLYGTYLGGSDSDTGYGIALDAGNTLLTGVTWSNDFALGYKGNGDAFAAKFNSSGGLVYKALLGGSNTDAGFGIAAAGGNAYLTGETWSSDFAATGYKGQNDAFVAKLNSSGGVTYRTLVGGTGWDRGNGIAVDNLSQPYVVGGTTSTDLPVGSGSNAGEKDAFLFKLNSGGSLTFAAYLGGTNDDEALGLALDSYAAINLAGVTGSNNFPVAGTPWDNSLGGSADAFVARMDLALPGTDKLTYSTYLGGSSYDEALAVAVDSSARATVVGYTQSSDFPMTSGAYDTSLSGTQDAFAARVATAKGSLQITKTVNWNGVTPDTIQTFEICITGPSYPSGNCKTVGYNGGALTWANLIPGSYTVSETSPGTQWTVHIAGSPAAVSASNTPATASVENTRMNGGLQVTKTVYWNGITPDTGQTFQICITGSSYPTGNCKIAGYNGGTLTWGGLVPGNYTVSETDPGNQWTVSISGSPAAVPMSGTATAAVTNSRKLGSLQVTKTVDWNGMPSADGQTFEICIAGLSYPTGNCKTFTYPGALSQTWTGLIPGQYSVTETDPGPQWSVGVPSAPASVPADGGQAPAVVSNKHAVPPKATVVTITASGNDAVLTWQPVTLDINNNPVSINKYEIWRGQQPYSGLTLYAEVLAPGASFPDPNVLNDAAHNYYYVVRAVSTAGLSSADSNRTGKFTYPLVPGP